MKQFNAFTKKEFLELFRTGKLLLLLIIFILFGIMSPAIAKLTPWMMNLFSDSFTEAGMTIIMDMDVTAMTSWTQFYKNISMVLVIFMLMSANTLTAEYQKGTLINILTKGMPRFKVLLSKTFTLFTTWTCGFWLSFGITYGYNFYFWDNRIASNLFFAACCYYLVGIWLISLLLLASGILKTNSGVLAVTGGIFVICYLVSFLPATGRYLPVQLLSASALLTNATALTEYTYAIGITILLSVISIILSIFSFNKRMV